MSIELVPNATYYAGADRPFFVTQSMVSDYLRDKGFADIAWHKRKVALPSNVNPRGAAKYSDEWDEWVSATYTGAAGTLDPPVDLPWVVIDRPQTTTSIASPSTRAPSWQAASEQASRAAAAAAIASQRAKTTVPSSSVAPVPPSLAQTSPDAPRDTSMARNSTGAALFIGGITVLLFGVGRAILAKRRK